MPDFTRYAIFYVPPEGSALARFGAGWLGWDNAGGVAAEHPAARVDVAALTKTPRKYGFHGTLKPPFRLAEGTEIAGLDQAARAMAARHAPFETAPLGLRLLGRFIALVPSQPSPALAALAGACVTALDAYRAPPGEAELARRRAAGLTAPQEALLQRWGYPYVLDEFRFHLTLTGAVETDAAQAALSCLGDLTAPFCTVPFAVTEVALCGEGEDGRFRIITRYPLVG